MTKRHEQACAVAGFLNIFGDAWSWLIVREAFYGATRFSEFQRNTGIARNLLSQRLSMLVDEGILRREEVGKRGPRSEYRLTAKGEALMPILVTMVQWSNEHVFGAGREPIRLLERNSRKALKKVEPRTARGRALRWPDIVAQPGPGADKFARARILESVIGVED
ncbi:MAG: helix-turn-helix domain-containing protein [Myxococcota bacterium]